MDIAVASGYAMLCLSIIVLASPVAPHEVAVTAAARASLDSAISGYVSSVGMPFLADAPEADLCASAEAASNGTVAIGLAVQGEPCADFAPPSGIASSSLGIDLNGRSVVIEAWLERQ